MYTLVASLFLAALCGVLNPIGLPAAPPWGPHATFASPADSSARVAQTPTSSGGAFFTEANFADAEAAYASTLRGDPRNADAELGLARIALYRNDLDNAERHARALAGDAPNDRRAAALLAFIAERRDDGPDYRIETTGAEVVVPFVRLDPLPEVQAFVNGKRASLLLDTGAPGLDLAPSFVKELGVATEPAGQGTFAGGLRADLRIGHIDSLDLGGARLRSIPIHVPPEMPPGVDGVIGTNVLYRFLSTIDYPKRRLVLRSRAASETFEADAAARRAVVVPMLLVPDHFIFARARINDAPEALFNVDTGGPGIGVDLAKAEMDAAGIVPDTSHPGSFTGGGGPTRTLPFVADVTLGDRTFRKVPGVYLPDGDRTSVFPFAVAGTISQELFRRGALTFDFVAMKLVLDIPPEP